MQTLAYNKILPRMTALCMGLLLSMAVCGRGYCLDPPVITPLDEFFIEHNGGPVLIAPPDWRLIVDGLVAQPLALTIEEIHAYPSQTVMATVECGGNPFAFKVADLIGNAEWTGVPVRTLLEQAGPLDTAASVIFTALDGYSARIGLENIYARDDIMLAYGMNGETLPAEQGYPLRLIFPGISGNMWVQWVSRVEVSPEKMAGEFIPLPPHCQIFTPEHDQIITAASRRLYGMALAGEREIDSVEVSTDGGFSWNAAEMLTSYVPNVWRHWEYEWSPPAPGNYTLAARAIDASGAVQPEGGIYGWNIFSIDVSVPECTLALRHKKIFSRKLFKDREVSLRISGAEGFDPSGVIDLGPLEVLQSKINARKGILRIRALVPAGLEPQLIPVSVGECFGEIEIL